MTSYELTRFKKMVRVWKTKSLLFCLRYDPLIVFRRQNHITFIFIKTLSHDLLVQMAYSWALLPERAIGTTITSVYFFIDSLTALVLVDFNCVSDQRLYNIHKMFLLQFSAKPLWRWFVFPSPSLWIPNWFDGSTWKRGDAKKSQS